MAYAKKKQNNHTYVLLHNVRSAQNVGAIFRTADAAGVSEIILTGYTPDPIDRFGRPQKAIVKTALGAEQSVPWRHEQTASKVIASLKQKGVTVIGIEQDKKAVDYKTVKVEKNVAFVFGSEVRGLSKALRDQCDKLVEIPMRGDKESLNVATSVGVVLFRILNV